MSPELITLILTYGLPLLGGFLLRHYGGNLSPILAAILRAISGGGQPSPLIPSPTPIPAPDPSPRPILPSGGAIRDLLLAAGQELLRKLLAGETLTPEETRAMEQFRGLQTMVPGSPQERK